MNYIKMEGRIGNQMFFYALYLQLNKSGHPAKIIFLPEDKKSFGSPLADKLKVKFKELTNSKAVLIDWVYRALNSLEYRIPKLKFSRPIIHEYKLSDPFEILETDNAYLIGYWQSEKYFPDPDVQSRLREDFACPDEYYKNTTFRQYAERIKKSTHSVSLHVRRGDYVQVPMYRKIFHDICTEEYYKSAMNMMSSIHDDTTFYIFSDDVEWIQEHFKGDNIVLVSSSELSDMHDFYLMSFCDSHIIANSSFSWWAAWLGDGENSTHIAPTPWLRGKDFSNIYREKMILIDPSGQIVDEPIVAPIPAQEK